MVNPFYLLMKKTIIIAFLLFFYNIQSQNLLQKYDSIKKLPDVYVIKLADNLIEKAFTEKQYKISAKIAHDLSVRFFRKKDYERAIFYANKEIDDLDLVEEKDDKIYNKGLYQLALFYRYNSEYDESIRIAEKVIKLNKDKQRIAQSYANIGVCLYNKGDYSKAINYLEKSIKIFEEIEDYRGIYSPYTSIVNVYVRLNDKRSLLKGLEILKKTEALQSKIKFSSRMRYSLNSGFGNIYNLLGEESFLKSKHYYELNIELNKNQDPFQLGKAYSNLSDLLNKYKIDSAGYYALKSIPLVESSSVNLTSSYINYVDYLINKEDYEKALEEVKNALKINFTQNKSIVNYTKSDLYTVTNKVRALICLRQRSQVLISQYFKNRDVKYLQEVMGISDVYNKLSLIIDETSSDDYTKLYWRKKASNVYLYGAYAAHLLGNTEQAFVYMEKSKAILLSDGVLKNTKFQNLPKHISDQETQLRKYIYELENKLAIQEDKQLQDSLFNAKLSYENYVDSLKIQFPKYFDRKLNVSQISLTEAQKDLQKDEVLISYIWNEFDDEKEVALGLVTTQTSSLTFEISEVDSLQSRLTQYKKLISQPFATQEDQQSYQRVAYQLYQQLIPEGARNSLVGKKLMIIPDGNLQNIPFEAFMTSQEENSYLIQKTDVSYSYSYSFLKHNEQVKRESNQSFIGYSPINFKELSSLQNSKAEVEEVTAQFDGIAKIQNTATKEDFLQNSSQSNIIHLATHADAGKNPWIAFADDKLELHELYTYKNNADLVTLSACNTSLGEIAKGEGVLSLARGFFYSGSKSVVSSLWEVNDQSTAQIMTSFYKNLKEGETKSEALNNAKRAYLNTHELSDQSPYYWSSFVLIGDAGQLESDPNYLLYVGIGLLILVVLFFFRKRSKNIG